MSQPPAALVDTLPSHKNKKHNSLQVGASGLLCILNIRRTTGMHQLVLFRSGWPGNLGM